jgi:hypothetical protein
MEAILDSIERASPAVPGLRDRALLVDAGNSPELYAQLLRGRAGALPDLFAVAVPDCVRSASKALSGWRNPWWKLWIGHLEEGELEMELPAWPLQAGLDRHGRLAARRLPRETLLRLRYRFHPDQLDREARTAYTVELRARTQGSDWIRLAQGTLGMCPD